jgi:tetratricopeptide (TPR) repeat protein
MNSSNPLAHFNLGTLFVQTGDYNRALEAFSITIKNDSSFADAYRNIAIIHYLQENYKESLYFFEKYLYLANDDQAKETVRKDIEEIKRRLRN